MLLNVAVTAERVKTIKPSYNACFIFTAASCAVCLLKKLLSSSHATDADVCVK